MTDEVDDVDEPDPEELPATAGEFAEAFPDVWRAYGDLGAAAAEAGPMDDDTERLVKLALAIGAGSEGAVHSHTRRALDQGVDRERLRQVPALAITTLGFPRAMAGRTWIEDEL